jgi:hypothetical protein
MKQQKKFNSDQQQEHIAEHKVEQRQGQEFTSVEDVLRFDASQTDVPLGIAKRLQESSKGLPPPPRSWWERIFKR